MERGAETFVDALLEAVGPQGTVVSMAVTDSSFFKKPSRERAFHSKKKSYAGSLPNYMIRRCDSVRSLHPTCSFVSIGKHSEEILRHHDEECAAYEPVRKIVDLNGKCLLVGCVDTSPGFTTTHLAEFDLGLSSLSIFPWLNSTYFVSKSGELELFRRPDPGLCSNGFYKFYALYVRAKILKANLVGDAYSIIAPAKECFEIDLEALRKNAKFGICGSKSCYTCNAGRWDRIHHAPGFYLSNLAGKFKRKISTLRGGR